MVKILETPRDAMQGIANFIPTKIKVDYINCLLKVGFDIIDFGSFVSPKAIPQLKDSGEVIKNLDLLNSKSRIMATVANTKGGEIASQFDEINYFGFPFSISPTFLKLNINSDIEKAYQTASELYDLCNKYNKELVIYISMAFGNPYGDDSNNDILYESIERLSQIGVTNITLADVTGISKIEDISSAYSFLTSMYPENIFGLHLHSTNHDWYDKIDAAYKNGCIVFDGVIGGMGGCPMADHELVANLETVHLLEYFNDNKVRLRIDNDFFKKASAKAEKIFSHKFL